MACKTGDDVLIVTPDRDIQSTVLKVGNTYTEIHRLVHGHLPRGVREDDTYLPRHSEQGEFSGEEMRVLVAAAQRQLQGEVDRRRVSGKLGPDGMVHAAPGQPRAKARASAESDDEVGESKFRWACVFSSGDFVIGQEVFPSADANQMTVGGKRYCLYSAGGQEFLARGFEAPDFERNRKALTLGQNTTSADDRDVRILPVIFDSANERWRTVSESVPEYEEIDFEDFPLTGPRTLAHDCRQLRRLGLDFSQHHESWLKKSGVRSTDRSVHEHASICRVLSYMMSYDQLNLPSLASAEALNRRRTLIEHAHQGRPDAPVYEAAEEFLGVRDSADGSLIDPALAQHAARRQANRAEVLKQTRLAAEERRLAKKGDGKGPGKGKDGAQAPEKP